MDLSGSKEEINEDGNCCNIDSVFHLSQDFFDYFHYSRNRSKIKYKYFDIIILISNERAMFDILDALSTMKADELDTLYT